MKRLVLSLAFLAGCFGAHRDNPAMGDDAPTCGDTVCDETPDSVCVDGDTLRTFAPACTDGACSYPSEEIECGTDGCCTDHCCGAVPSNAADFGNVEATGLVVAPPDGMFDTDVDCVETSALGKCTVVTRADLPQACVCRADEITIGTLKIKGARALVLLAKKQVTVVTKLDVTGSGGIDGPGAIHQSDESTTTYVGGAGGSFATVGAGIGAPAAYGEPSLVPLLGGTGGKLGGLAVVGGGGGGALQITAGERIEIQGLINAGGGGGMGGRPTYAYAGGAGGGAGGGILVEAPTVVVSGVIVANGGGGGGGGGGTVGASSGGFGTGGGKGDPMTASSGGVSDDGHGCPLYGYVYGGRGGTGGFGTDPAYTGGANGYDSRCLDTAFVGGGGGGGGVGRIRINTTTGCQCGGSKISPQPSFGTLVKQ